MKKKRTYQTSPVQQVQVVELLRLLVTGCIIALDVAKEKFVAAFATSAGEVVKLVRFTHPTETELFLKIVKALREGIAGGAVKAAMEPTGTYGDPIRYQMMRVGVDVEMVSPKRTHDTQELFDNVPSMHDPKSAVLVAKLCSMGLSTPWSPAGSTQRRLRALVDQRQYERGREEATFGRMEALIARHWPEFGQWMDVRTQRSALELLTTYPSPSLVVAAADEAKAVLRRASRHKLSKEAIEGVVDGARATLGVPMEAEEAELLRTLSMQQIESSRRVEALEVQMREVGQGDPMFARLSTWMGVYTAAVVLTHVNPAQYMTAKQLEKACGLNLREKSSGEHTGRLSITKRGPGVVRQVLYLFALRMIQDSPAVRAWYKRRRGYTEDSKQRALVAVMRKLVRALFHVARGAAFEASKLFDLRRLELEEGPTPAPKPITARTAPRSIARGRKRAKPSATSSASA